MDELIVVEQKQVGGEVKPTVNAKSLHVFLDIGKGFSAWIQDRIRIYNFLENHDFIILSDSGEKSGRGRPTKDYHLTIDMAKELSMIERTPKGKEARQYFIKCERSLLMIESKAIQKPPRKKSVPLADQSCPLDAHLPVPYFRIIAGYKSILKGQKMLGKEPAQASIDAARIVGHLYGVDLRIYGFSDFPLVAIPDSSIAPQFVDLPKPLPATPLSAETVPAAAVQSHVMPGDPYMTPTMIAKRLSIFTKSCSPDPQEVNQLLKKVGLQVYAPNQYSNWHPTKEGRVFVKWREVPKTNGLHGETVRQMIWSVKVLDILHEFLAKQRANASQQQFPLG